MKKLTALIPLLIISCIVSAQSIEEQLMQRRVSCYDVIANAANVLPQLYASRSFDSLQIALQIAQRYCDSNAAPFFYLQILFSIQQSGFSLTDTAQNENMLDMLESYAARYRTRQMHSLSRGYFYYVDNEQQKLYKLIHTWATNLLADSNLTNTEAFICNTLAGNIKNPQATVKAAKTKYPELYAALRKTYSYRRTNTDGNIALISGVWLPNQNAKVLGVHPQIGFQLGGRSKLNEVDFTLLLRFANTPESYQIFRRDSLYSTNHFAGGYIGFDYTGYIVHTTNFEIGLTAGAGYDGFDVLESDKYKERENDLKPYTISSYNFNAGMRINYYFNPNLYIGIGGRFNKVDYKNKGGTNFHGNAVSIDFFIGG